MKTTENKTSAKTKSIIDRKKRAQAKMKADGGTTTSPNPKPSVKLKKPNLTNQTGKRTESEQAKKILEESKERQEAQQDANRPKFPTREIDGHIVPDTKQTVEEILNNKTVGFQMVYLMKKLGLTDSEIQTILGVNESTFKRWKQDAEFRAVLDLGKQEAKPLFETALIKRLMGYTIWEYTYEANIHVDPETKEKYLLDGEMVHTKTVEKEVVASDRLIQWVLERLYPDTYGKKGEDDNKVKGKTPVFIVPTFNNNQLIITDSTQQAIDMVNSTKGKGAIDVSKFINKEE